MRRMYTAGLAIALCCLACLARFCGSNFGQSADCPGVHFMECKHNASEIRRDFF